MPVIFRSDGHIYETLNENLDKDKIKWTSVTSFVGMFKPKFDAEAQSKKSSKNKRSKWYKIPPKKILEIWDNESKRAIGLGNWYHDEREKRLLEFSTIERDGVEVPIIKPITDSNGI